MTTCYKEIPHNYSDIEAYVIDTKEIIITELLFANRCYFYDACAFRKHANMSRADFILDYYNATDGVVIITRVVLMELASHSGVLNREYIDYIKKIHQKNINILVVYEEDLFEILSICYNSNVKLNEYLRTAICVTKFAVGTVNSTLRAEKTLSDEIFKKNTNSSTLYERFFSSIRAKKESGDNLGEETICLCIHLLSNIPNTNKYRFLVLTEDKGAIGHINKTTSNIYDYLKIRSASALSTTKLGQLLYEEGIVSSKEEIVWVLSNGNLDEEITYVGSETYDLKPQEKTMKSGEIADLIMLDGALHINY